jgi:hypothetical protein
VHFGHGRRHGSMGYGGFGNGSGRGIAGRRGRRLDERVGLKGSKRQTCRGRELAQQLATAGQANGRGEAPGEQRRAVHGCGKFRDRASSLATAAERKQGKARLEASGSMSRPGGGFVEEEENRTGRGGECRENPGFAPSLAIDFKCPCSKKRAEPNHLLTAKIGADRDPDAPITMLILPTPTSATALG